MLFRAQDKKKLTRKSSRLNSPYSRRVPLPLVKIPQPDIMIVPERRFVIVAGKSRACGKCVVTPTSILPDHLSTSLSILICEQNKIHLVNKIFSLEDDCSNVTESLHN